MAVAATGTLDVELSRDVSMTSDVVVTCQTPAHLHSTIVGGFDEDERFLCTGRFESLHQTVFHCAGYNKQRRVHL